MRETLPQSFAFDKLSRNDVTWARLKNFINRDDIRVIQCRSGARFLLKAAQAIGVFGEGRRQNLERHVAAEPAVVSQINFAHPAATNERKNLERPDDASF